jgi:phosphoserine phosphatase RsbU/P
MNGNNKNKKDKKLYDTLKSDISEGGFKGDIATDFDELKEFFLNDERKKQLAGMGKFKRFFYMAWWLLSELLLKLTPTRRLVLVIGIFLLVMPGRFGVNSGDVSILSNTSIFGGILILFVLMLELKDKLVAKDELSVGRTVQKALMSERNPTVPGWKIWLFTQPANDVGGDLVDIIQLDENRSGVTIADVSGKGLGAALLMAKLQTIIRAFTPEHKSLSFLFEKLNSAFHKDILPNSFASMVYIQLKENYDKIELINAGHLPPIIIKDRKLTHLNKGNVALGLAGNSKFKSENFKLQNGDYFIAFSDGVTEARNIQGNFFGLDRLAKFLQETTYNSPEQLGQKLLHHVELFIGEAKTHDDLSIIILKRE